MSKKKGGVGKFIAGLAIGAGLGVLFAPKKGSETRAELKAKLEELYKKAKSLDVQEVKETIQAKITEIKESMEDLDKEKVLSIAKEKAKKLQAKCEELVKYVVEKGTPVMEKTATVIREKATVLTQEVLEKLQSKNPKVAEEE